MTADEYFVRAGRCLSSGSFSVYDDSFGMMKKAVKKSGCEWAVVVEDFQPGLECLV
jgi:hypothetical protein